MDALKILSRSTNRPDTRKPKILEQNVPSAGPAISPKTVVSNDHTNSHSKPEISRKRKRKSHSQPPKIDYGIDFFDSDQRGTTTENSSPPPRQRNPVPRQKTDIVIDGENATSVKATVKCLDLQECREILKSNKIKISKLREAERPSDATRAHKKSARRVDIRNAIEDTSKRKKQKTDEIIEPLTAFSQLNSKYGVSSRIVDNMVAQGYKIPTEVQLGGLPILLEPFRASKGSGRDTSHSAESPVTSEFQEGVDLLTVAPTGSGKTLAFLIPILESILRYRRFMDSELDSERDRKFSKTSQGPHAIVVAPTKELAHQIVNEARKLVVNTGIKVSLVRKGMQLKSNTPSDEVEIVKSHVLVSTPLTMIHAMKDTAGEVQVLDSVRHLVLDEADVLLDPLFQKQTLQIWESCASPLLRVSLWSATMGSSIEDLAKSIADTRWKRLEAEHGTLPSRPSLLRLVVGLKDSAVASINHKLIYAANEQGKLMALRQLLRPTDSTNEVNTTLIPPFLVFTQTIPRAIALHSEVLYDVPQEAGGASRIAVLHADLSETARDRVMSRFRAGEVWVLITTDLLSRGVDFRGINGVVNYDFPNSSAAYIHRVGRTGRAGREGGVAVTLYAKEDIPYVKSVANVIAASERQRDSNGAPQDSQQWLVNLLPKPNKNDKKRLKKRGIESRRATRKDVESNTGSAKSRISTKSGYERRLDNNRKAAIGSNRNTSFGSQNNPEEEESDGDFEGLSD